MIDLDTGSASTLVLKGAKELSSSSGLGEFGVTGTAESGMPTVRLDPVELSTGSGRIRLEVELPAGYKVNETTPSVFEWEVQGGVVELPDGSSGSVVMPAFPLELPVEFLEGSGQLALNLYLIYCEAEQEQVCLIERVRFESPLRVLGGAAPAAASSPTASPAADTAANTVVLRHRVELPNL